MAFTRRGGRSPERAQRVREAPAAQDACPRYLKEVENLLWGCFGGDARGAAKGAQPHNRPHLAARRAGVPNSARRRNPVPAGQNKLEKLLPAISKLRAVQASKTSPDGKFRARWEKILHFPVFKRLWRNFRVPGSLLRSKHQEQNEFLP